jgi:hypothetical protein
MRLTPLARLALLSLAAALAAGCYPTYGPSYGPPPPYSGYPGNIYVSWTFAGAGCAQTPAVVQVMVSVPNDPLPIVPNTFACQVGNPPPNQLGIYNYNPGSYIVSLSGLDASGNVIWSGSSTVVVNGNVATTIDLQPIAPTNSTLVSWSFAPAVGSSFPPCTALGDSDPDRIDSVALYVDGTNSPAQIYDCTQGNGATQVSIPSLTPGNHSLQLVAYQAGLSYVFAQSDPVTLNIVANTPSSQAFSLNWLVGGTGVAWTYPSPDACASSVTSVTASFSGPGNTGYSVSGYACETPLAPFKRLPSASGGVTYALAVSAFGAPPTDPVIYSGSVSAVTIQPGHFYDGTTGTVVSVPLK